MALTDTSSRASFRWPAHPDDRFSTTVAAGMVGQTFPLHLPDETTTGRIVAAAVVDDGRALEITFEADADLGALGLGRVEALEQRPL